MFLSVIAIYGLFRFKHEKFPMPDNRMTDVRNSYLCRESSYGLERVNVFRYNSRHVPGCVLLSERIGFWWMQIACLSRWWYGTGCREIDSIPPGWEDIRKKFRIFSPI